MTHAAPSPTTNGIPPRLAAWGERHAAVLLLLAAGVMMRLMAHVAFRAERLAGRLAPAHPVCRVMGQYLVGEFLLFTHAKPPGMICLQNGLSTGRLALWILRVGIRVALATPLLTRRIPRALPTAGTAPPSLLADGPARLFRMMMATFSTLTVCENQRILVHFRLFRTSWDHVLHAPWTWPTRSRTMRMES